MARKKPTYDQTCRECGAVYQVEEGEPGAYARTFCLGCRDKAYQQLRLRTPVFEGNIDGWGDPVPPDRLPEPVMKRGKPVPLPPLPVCQEPEEEPGPWALFEEKEARARSQLREITELNAAAAFHEAGRAKNLDLIEMLRSFEEPALEPAATATAIPAPEPEPQACICPNCSDHQETLRQLGEATNELERTRRALTLIIRKQGPKRVRARDVADLVEQVLAYDEEQRRRQAG